MLHPSVLHDLLETEVAQARERLGQRLTRLDLRGSVVYAMLPSPTGGEAVIQLDGADYDAQPFRVLVLRDGQPVPAGGWNELVYGSEHPVLRRPFLCISGTYEYHCYPGHHEDVWDKYRSTIRLGDLLDRMLTKVGR